MGATEFTVGTIATTLQEDLDLTFCRATGRITAADLLAWVVRYYAGKPTRLILWDFNDAELADLSSDALKSLANEVKKRSVARVGGKTAFVSDADLAFGLGRMFQVFSELEGIRVEYMIFRSMAEAREWLGV